MTVKLTSSKEEESLKGIKYLLHKKLAAKEPPRSLDVLHASELTNPDCAFCPRERALLLRDGDNRPHQFLGTALNVTFQIGRWYEHKIQNDWLREWAIGDWECLVCKEKYLVQTDPNQCIKCGSGKELIKYIEPRAYSPKYDTSCGIDLMMWRNNKIQIVEIKTIKAEDFEELLAPLHEHHCRTQFYLDLLERSDWMNYDVDFNLESAEILYVCKGFGFKDNLEGREGLADSRCSPFKSYTIHRGEHKYLKDIYADALAVKKYKKTKKLPPRVLCQSPTCRRSDKCTKVSVCFGEE